jgi:hypothetical protein
MSDEHKLPQCAPANRETSCLFEIGDISRKLRLRCGCQFPWCALALKDVGRLSFGNGGQIGRIHSHRHPSQVDVRRKTNVVKLNELYKQAKY